MERDILVVDDEIHTCRALVMLLRVNGYSASYALNGDDALAMFGADNDRFELVITDFNMPGMNGLELGRRLKAINGRVRVFLCSGSFEERDANEETRKVLDGFFDKPLNFEPLFVAIRGLTCR